jgi:hypothetical protein
MYDSIKVKPKPQWQSWDIGDARNVELLLRKATGNRRASQAVWAANSNAIGAGLPKPVGAHVM